MHTALSRLFLIPLAVLALGSSPTWSAPGPKTIGFTGMLADPSGTPVADGDYTVRLSLYPSVDPGVTNAVWHEEKTVRVARGLFSTALGDETGFPDALNFSQALFVGVRMGDGAEMQPRLALQGVPYALFAHSVADNSIGGAKLAVDPAALSKITDGQLTLKNGNLGIGTAYPGFTLTTPNDGMVATSVLRLQNTYLENGTFGVELSGVDNGRNGHDLHVRGRTSPTGAFSDLLIVRNDGLVGIRTEPTNALSVDGSANITSNLGIGTILPTAKLDVRGDIRFGSTGQYSPVAGDIPLRAVVGSYQTANGGSLGFRSGFTVNRNGVGDYTVTFNSPFGYLPTVSILPFGNSLYGVYLRTLTPSSIWFQTYSNGALTEVMGFNLMAIGAL